MTSLTRRISVGLTTLGLVFAQVIMPVQVAFAATSNSGKTIYDTPTQTSNGNSDNTHYALTICHATASTTNPYEQITIDVDATNGHGANDHTSHTGGIYDGTKGSGWGDIIPSYQPFANEPGYDGLNWTAEGKAIYYNDCVVPSRDAVAAVTITPATCEAAGSAIVSTETKYATLNDPLVTSTGLHTATFTATTGHLFANGESTMTVEYTVPAQLTGEQCESELPRDAVAAVTITPATCEVNGSATVADTTENAALNGELAQSVGQHTATFTATSDHLFANGEPTMTVEYTVPAQLTGEQCGHVSKPCTLAANQTYDKPWSQGEYQYPEYGSSPEGGVSGSATFTDKGLYLQTPNVESYTDGLIDAGNTYLSDIDNMSYKIMRDASSTGNDQTTAAYILHVDLDGDLTTTTDQDYLFFEPIYNGPVTTGTFQTWDVINSGNAVWWGFKLSNGNPSYKWSQILAQYPDAIAMEYGFNQGTYNQGTNTYLESMTFDCQTTAFVAGKGGNGGGDTPTEPETPSTPTTPTTPSTPVVPGRGSVTPTELPETGASSRGMVIALIAAVAAYGALYFAQPKRKFDQ